MGQGDARRNAIIIALDQMRAANGGIVTGHSLDQNVVFVLCDAAREERVPESSLRLVISRPSLSTWRWCREGRGSALSLALALDAGLVGAGRTGARYPVARPVR